MRLGKCYIPILFTVIITAFIWLVGIGKLAPRGFPARSPDPVFMGNSGGR